MPAANPALAQAGRDVGAMGGGSLMGIGGQDNRARQQYKQSAITYICAAAPGRRFPASLPDANAESLPATLFETGFMCWQDKFHAPKL